MHRGERSEYENQILTICEGLAHSCTFFLPADQTLEFSDEEQTRRAVHSHNISSLNHTTVRKKVGANLLLFCLLSSIHSRFFLQPISSLFANVT